MGEDEVHQEEGKVARAEIVGEHEDEEADDRDGNGIAEEPEAVAEVVREVAMAVRVEDHEDVGRRDEKKRDDAVVTQSASEGWEEVLES